MKRIDDVEVETNLQQRFSLQMNRTTHSYAISIDAITKMLPPLLPVAESELTDTLSVLRVFIASERSVSDEPCSWYKGRRAASRDKDRRAAQHLLLLVAAAD